ncbi:MAG: hypothetical protein J3K34DRAFT_148765 [Monoraphidium minutum]|nr:MAG: hypothetical protein J3K34DRAFT_148765 [Monoraphidium minutum]
MVLPDARPSTPTAGVMHMERFKQTPAAVPGLVGRRNASRRPEAERLVGAARRRQLCQLQRPPPLNPQPRRLGLKAGRPTTLPKRATTAVIDTCSPPGRGACRGMPRHGLCGHCRGCGRGGAEKNGCGPGGETSPGALPAHPPLGSCGSAAVHPTTSGRAPGPAAAHASVKEAWVKRAQRRCTLRRAPPPGGASAAREPPPPFSSP